MKKLLCILLIVALFLPSAVLADETDPIVGCWYFFYDMAVTPEMQSAFPEYDKLIGIYWFSESGIIYGLGLQIVGTDGTPDYSSVGKWTKSGDSYIIGLIGTPECSGILEGDSLFYEANGYPGCYMRLNKMYPLNPYKDLVRK